MERWKDKISRRKKWARHWKGFYGGSWVQRAQSSAMRCSSVPGAQCGWLSFGFGIWQKLRIWLLTLETNKGPFVFSKVGTKGLYLCGSSHSLTTQNRKPWTLGAPETQRKQTFLAFDFILSSLGHVSLQQCGQHCAREIHSSFILWLPFLVPPGPWGHLAWLWVQSPQGIQLGCSWFLSSPIDAHAHKKMSAAPVTAQRTDSLCKGRAETSDVVASHLATFGDWTCILI